MVKTTRKILNVDLSTEEIREEELDEEIIAQYLGGYGLGVRLLIERIPQDADPLGPDNILGFFPGLFTGSMVPFSGRYVVCAKSPLTGGWGDSNSGGFFGPEIRKCGYAGILFKGISEKPVYLLIKDGKASLEDASDLWGKDAVETDEILKEKHGAMIKVAAIGKAGENVCYNAGIVNDRGRLAGRSGMGAVMGSKKLKAVALQGKNKYPYENLKELLPHIKQYQKRINKMKDSKFYKMFNDKAEILAPLMRVMKIPIFSTDKMAAQYMGEYGTSYSTLVSVEVGDAPIKNWSGVGHDLYPKNLSGQLTGKNLNNWKIKKFGCFSCPVQCGAILSIPEAGIDETHRPEYETLAAFGPLILNGDLYTIFRLNEMLNREGLDSISAGGIVAFAVECYKNGIITKEDTGGLELNWNRSEYIIPLLKMIINREKIGNILADGVKRAAEKLGNGAEQFAVHANGQELPMHDSRYTPSLGTTYVADPTPGRHTAASAEFLEIGPIAKFIKGHKLEIPKFKRYKYDTKGPAQALLAKFYQAYNAMGFCLFGAWMGPFPLMESLKYGPGLDLTVDDLIKIGHRIQTLRQLFNIKHGALRFSINKRALGLPPMDKGPLKGVKLDIKTMVKDYFSNMDWDPSTGYPKKELLQELGLDFAEDIINNSKDNESVEALPQ